MIAIKIGGSVVGGLHPTAVADIARAARGGGAIIVHGGGKEVTRVCGQLGKEARFVTSPGGIRSRYTDRETAEIFTMVMCGRISKSIVAMLQAAGVNAVGLSGVDGRLIEAERKRRLLVVNERGRRQAIEGGYTGRITRVNAGLLSALVGQGMVPVVSPVAIGAEAEFLNVDGDRAAAHVAGAAGADRVLFVTDVDGLMLDGRLVRELDLQGARDARPRAGPGMEKKLLAAAEAIEMGVGEALIASGARENPISSALAHDRCTVIRDG